jgi:hypothetical protein
MAKHLQDRLQAVADREILALDAIGEEEASSRAGDNWSRKEELGHLIDSATNNHVRFVRGSLESGFQGPSYDQDGWVRQHSYNDVPWPALTRFWHGYNSLLAYLIGQIPDDRLGAECRVGSGQAVTLGFLIEDYILHMQHHLDHILRRPEITQYPGAALGV